jgi:hypothetical protein
MKQELWHVLAETEKYENTSSQAEDLNQTTTVFHYHDIWLQDLEYSQIASLAA